MFLRLLSASSALRLRQIGAVRKARFEHEHEHEHGIPLPWGGRMEQSPDWRPLTGLFRGVWENTQKQSRQGNGRARSSGTRSPGTGHAQLG